MRQRIHELWAHLRAEHSDPARLGWAVAIGVFLGTLPVYGIHLPICIFAAWLFRLNKITVYLAANISNPLIAPLLVAGGIAIGEYVRFGVVRPIDMSSAATFLESLSVMGGAIPDRFLSCLLGDAILGAGLGAVLGPAVYLWAKRRQADVDDSPPEPSNIGSQPNVEPTPEPSTDSPAS